MQQSSGKRERRRYPRFFIDLPLEYQETDTPLSKGGIVVNASEAGLLFESVRAIPLGTKLNVSVLFPRRFELAEFKLEAEIVWKEPLLKEEWEGYQYGLNIVRLLDEDQWKLKMVLNGQFGLDALNMSSDERKEGKGSHREVVTIHRYKVLVVDDEEGVRRLLINFLSQQGHQCLQAMDGADALDKVIRNGFDAIITDAVMPNMDGIALTKELLKRFPKLPVMVMTGHDSEFSSVPAMGSGAREFIKKPFSLTEFATRFNKMMNGHEIPLGNGTKQNEALFQLQRRSLEETEKLKKEVVNLTSRLRSVYSRFKS
jgi:DNA-binding response OmpR family regulator